MSAAEACFDTRPAQWAFAIRIILDDSGLEHLHEGDAHALGNGGDVFQNRHTNSVYRIAGISGARSFHTFALMPAVGRQAKCERTSLCDASPLLHLINECVAGVAARSGADVANQECAIQD